MVQILRLTEVGVSTGVVIPNEMLVRLKVKQGDSLYAVETKDGFLLTPYNPSVEEQLEAGREFLKDYRNTFQTLAK